MKGLSADLKLAVESVIEGLKYEVDLDVVNPEKLTASMKAKTESFLAAKKLINDWQKSPNAPSEDTLTHYIASLVEAGDSAITTLRDALGRKVNYESLESDKHASFIKSKGIIYEAIVGINSGLVELRGQIESGNYNLGEREFKIGFPEKYAAGEFFPKKNYYKNWFNEEEDAVKICPKGTEGEIIEIDGLKIQLPKVPRKKDILFHTYRQKDQYWRRQEPPKGLSKKNSDEYIEYIHEEFRRRREGVWFMNNGKPTYLTGEFYFALQWCRMLDNGDFMLFREAQCRLAYHTKACKIDKRCLGQMFLKSRRTGFTYEKIFNSLEEITSTKNFRAGVTSKSEKDAAEAFLKFAYAYRSLPFFFRPIVKGREDSDKMLQFAKPADSSKASKKKGENDGELYLNSMIDYKATNNDAYDSTKLNSVLSDEFLKWSKPASYIKHWEQISPTMDEGGVIIGKAWLGSTMGARGEGGEALDKLLPFSNPAKRLEISGRTGSGLYYHFLPAHENSRRHTDKYGVCHAFDGGFENADGEYVKESAESYFLERRKIAKKKGESIYDEEMRKNPMSLRDLLISAESKNSFNKKNIAAQKEYNGTVPSPVRGNFVWKGGIKWGTVEWYPNESGRWLVAWMPPEEDRNKFRTINTHKTPTRNFCKTGVDPFSHAVVDDGGSDGAIVTVLENHYSTKIKMGIVCLYLSRPKNPHEFAEDVIKQAVFYSSEVLCESNKYEVLSQLKEKAYDGYAMYNPLDEKWAINRAKGKRGIAFTGVDNREALETITQSYIDEHIGYKEEIDNYGFCPFNQILTDWENFECGKRWTKWDAAVATGVALIATKKPKKVASSTWRPEDFGFNIPDRLR